MRDKGGLCEKCKPRTVDATYERHRGTAKDRGYGGDWPDFSKQYRHDNPLCVRCLPRTVTATVVHHIEELQGVDDPKRYLLSNLEALCRDCHERHHGRQ